MRTIALRGAARQGSATSMVATTNNVKVAETDAEEAPMPRSEEAMADRKICVFETVSVLLYMYVRRTACPPPRERPRQQAACQASLSQARSVLLTALP